MFFPYRKEHLPVRTIPRRPTPAAPDTRGPARPRVFMLQWRMRPSAGSLVIFVSSLVVLVLAAGAISGLVALLASPPATDALGSLSSNAWWFIYRPATDAAADAAPWRIGAAVAGALLALLGVARARTFYRRTPSPVIPFLMLFLLTLGLECLRAGTALLTAVNGSVSLSVFLTRVIYWGRFTGLLGLLAAGLYGLELKYPRVMVLGGVVMLVAFAMAAYIPVDRTVFLAQLTWKLGDEQSVWFLNLALAALAVLTGVVSALVHRGRRTALLAAGVALFIIAREAEFFALAPLPLAAGLAAQAAGTVLCLGSFAMAEV